MTKHRLFWPLVVLAVLLISNIFFTSSFCRVGATVRFLTMISLSAVS